MATKKCKEAEAPKAAAKVPTKKEVKALVTAAGKAAVISNTAIGKVREALIARGDLKPNCQLCKKLERADEIDCEFFSKVKELGY